MSLPRHFTAADLAAMPDDGLRYEVIRGELLVTPAPIPPHQKLVTRLMLRLGSYLEAHGVADQLRTSPADITLGPDTLVQPDLLVADTALADRTRSWTDVTTLFLVIEVVSPSTARTDRTLKRHVYQSHGVPQYWIVDGEQRLVEIWTPDATEPVTLRDRLVWRHSSLDTDCVIELERLFDLG